jgi:tetrahydromethanopterin S-methyltransferase subunit E
LTDLSGYAKKSTADGDTRSAVSVSLHHSVTQVVMSVLQIVVIVALALGMIINWT